MCSNCLGFWCLCNRSQHLKTIFVFGRTWGFHNYRSSCVGLTWPAARMLRERMLGSMMVSSASGVLRSRPEEVEEFIHVYLYILVSVSRKTTPNQIQTQNNELWDQALKLTHNELPDVSPLQVAARLVDDGHSNSSLQALMSWWDQEKNSSESPAIRSSNSTLFQNVCSEDSKNFD